MKTQLVVPCYNEAHRFSPESYIAYIEAGGDTGFIFVDDGSTDETLSILKETVELAPDRLQLLALEENAGKAEAVRAGINQALQGNCKYTGFWDSDLATPLEELTDFTAVLDAGTDIKAVFGARVKLMGRDITRSSVRHFLGRIFATYVSIALKLPIYDTQCGAKVFRADDDLRRVMADPFLSRWIFDVEIVIRYKRALGIGKDSNDHGFLYELPLKRWHGVDGSKIRIRDYFRAAYDLLRIFSNYS